MRIRDLMPLAAALALPAFATVALAQQTPAPTTPPQANSGTGPTTTSPAEVDKSQNMILPSAGSSGPSAAPTMVYDCQKRPEDCRVPAKPQDKEGASHTSPIKP